MSSRFSDKYFWREIESLRLFQVLILIIVLYFPKRMGEDILRSGAIFKIKDLSGLQGRTMGVVLKQKTPSKHIITPSP